MRKQTTSLFKLKGMTGNQTAQIIEEALNLLAGVTATVSYSEALVRVTSRDNSVISQVLEVIASKGYQAHLLSDNNIDDGDSLHVAIVGSGSSAFAAAIRTVEEGAHVTIIEAGKVIGGTCVNTGCVPSKILIKGAHIAYQQGHHSVAGVTLNRAKIDRKAMVNQQQAWVEKLRFSKYEHILASNLGITLLLGRAHFRDAKTLVVNLPDGGETVLQPDRILLAVGAFPAVPNIPGLLDTPYWSSTEALIAEDIPKHLIVMGGSVIALELAQAFRHLGAAVTILARTTLLSKEDPQIGERLMQCLQGEGIKVMLHTSIERVGHDGQQFRVTTQDGDECGDQLLIATGRQPNTSALRLEKAGIETDPRGSIVIDDHMRTNVEHIYAAGDCTNQPQFVYVAATAGTHAARNMTGDDVAINLSVMPAVVFTNPQVATVGLSVQQAERKGMVVESRTLELEYVPRALANLDTRGFIKLVAEKESGRIVGCQLLAAEGGEIIQTAVMAIANGMTIKKLADQLFPYLTMVEGLKLCAQTFNKDVTQLSCCSG